MIKNLLLQLFKPQFLFDKFSLFGAFFLSYRTGGIYHYSALFQIFSGIPEYPSLKLRKSIYILFPDSVFEVIFSADNTQPRAGKISYNPVKRINRSFINLRSVRNLKLQILKGKTADVFFYFFKLS